MKTRRSVKNQDKIIIAGPCAVENEEQLMATAFGVMEAGATLLRGGAFKPRTSPYAFQGLGAEGIRLLVRAKKATGLPIVTELVDVRHLDLFHEVDRIQIGARNMYNYEMLKEVGRSGKPVLLKRGLSATIEEWVMSAEYILSEGGSDIILCERGIRSFDPSTRNVLDLAAVALAKEKSGLPVIVDPSHGTGRRNLVAPMAHSALSAGADGLAIEVHNDPASALSDGPQSLDLDQFSFLMEGLGRRMAMERELAAFMEKAAV